MNKSDLISRITRTAEATLLVSYKENIVRDVVNIVIEQIEDVLALHERVELRGFGVFSVKTYEGERYSRNPATGVVRYIKRLPRVRFKAGKGLKERVDS